MFFILVEWKWGTGIGFKPGTITVDPSGIKASRLQGNQIKKMVNNCFLVGERKIPLCLQ